MDKEMTRNVNANGVYYHAGSRFSSISRKNGPAKISVDGTESWMSNYKYFRFPMYGRNKAVCINRFGQKYKNGRNGYFAEIKG